MCTIYRGSVETADKWLLSYKNWGFDAYDAAVYAQISYDEEAFCVKFTVEESNPLRNMKHHFDMVDKDSCVEFFVNFTPEQTDKYINFEVNALGCMNASFGLPGRDRINLKLQEVESFGITPEIKAEEWTVQYKISYNFIKKYYPNFEIGSCRYLLANLYKCASWSNSPHYLSYFKLGATIRDFHKPEHFGKLELKEG